MQVLKVNVTRVFMQHGRVTGFLKQGGSFPSRRWDVS